MTKTFRLTKEEREFLAYALDCAGAHLAQRADIEREAGVAADLIAKTNADEDKIRDWVLRFDPDYVG